MDLILWRHAEAEDGFPDMARELTPKGMKQADKMAAFLRPRMPADTRILVSPAVRTQQTVHALTKHYTTVHDIAPGATPASLLAAANWPEGEGCALLVGHQPTLGQVVTELLGDPAISFSIKKGAVWWLSRRDRDGDYQTQLRLVISPELL
jgi:phosphohistidine phosphatase